METSPCRNFPEQCSDSEALDADAEKLKHGKHFETYLLMLFAKGVITAKDLCILCHHASHAGAQGDCLDIYGKAPGAQTGKYSLDDATVYTIQSETRSWNHFRGFIPANFGVVSWICFFSCVLSFSVVSLFCHEKEPFLLVSFFCFRLFHFLVFPFRFLSAFFFLILFYFCFPYQVVSWTFALSSQPTFKDEIAIVIC